MPNKSLVEASKIHYLMPGNEDTTPSIEQLNAGSLQRIATATELMASNYVKLQNDYEYMRKSRDDYRRWYESELKRRIALKGVITKLKNKISNLQNEKQ